MCLNKTRGLFAKSVLALSAVAFIGIGIAFVAFPGYLLEAVGIQATPGTPLTDIRAIYGGLDLGVGLFLLYCLLRSELRLGLIAGAIILSCIAGGRIVGIAIGISGFLAEDAGQDAITFYLLALEISGGILSAFAATRVPRNP